MIDYKKKLAAYLGPEGSYSYIAAKKYFGDEYVLVSKKSILDVFEFTSQNENNSGLVPVENSSGGPIPETLDLLINNSFNIYINSSIDMHIKLSLIGHKDEEIKKIYSHPVPLYHCNSWLRKNYPKAELNVLSSTSQSASLVASEKNSAAIGSIESAVLYGLDVLVSPIEQDSPNVTQFYVISSKKNISTENALNVKTGISAFIKNNPGSLYDFLYPFKEESVNLSRIISRPIHGKPNEYAFYIDIEGDSNIPKVKKSINKAAIACSSTCNLGSYIADFIYHV